MQRQKKSSPLTKSFSSELWKYNTAIYLNEQRFNNSFFFTQEVPIELLISNIFFLKILYKF